MHTTKQHIVFLTPGFAASEKDSTTIPALQVYLKSIKNTLPDTKFTLLSFQFPFTNKPYTWNGIEVIPLNGKNKRYKKLWIWKNAMEKLEEINKQQKINTIHSFWIGECSKIGYKFSKKHNTNHIVTVMGQDARLKNNYAKQLLNTSTKVVTLSKNHKKELQKNHQLDSIIIPWSLDINSFPELQNNTIDILGVGSLNSIKNYSDFIDIIFQISKSYPNLKVSIIGKGTLTETIKTKIEHLNLKNTISLLGELPRHHVLEKMAQSKILLHTSLYESFGFVFLEALYSGLHIVSYNVGLAKVSPNWIVGTSKETLTKGCETLLNSCLKEKTRILLNPKKETTNAYLTLYNA